MNIRNAYTQMLETVKAYLTTDEFGDPIIPIKRQRPLILVGPPGVGKTDLAEQVAKELGINLLSYSMTHHTRQSALGLPFIAQKDYETAEIDENQVTLYTMSEIIADIHEKMKKTGIKKGILFLDEINCVSETLSPAMLQFLQYKVFGSHRVPDGWVIIAAGNPIEYNKSAREFDSVTWDRLKRVDIEPDYTVWKEFAVNNSVHPAITTFLDAKPQFFYRIVNNAGKMCITTPRGWTDLSDIIKLYERLATSNKESFSVDKNLVVQYIQDENLAGEFAAFYTLFNKYKQNYRAEDILEGRFPEDVLDRAKSAPFDEKHALVTILLDAFYTRVDKVILQTQTTRKTFEAFKAFTALDSFETANAVEYIKSIIKKNEEELEAKKAAGTLSPEDSRSIHTFTATLNRYLSHFSENVPEMSIGKRAYEEMRSLFAKDKQTISEITSKAEENLENIFAFSESAFLNGGKDKSHASMRVMEILVKELALNHRTATFIVLSNISENSRFFRYSNALNVTCEAAKLAEGAQNIVNLLDNLRF